MEFDAEEKANTAGGRRLEKRRRGKAEIFRSNIGKSERVVKCQLLHSRSPSRKEYPDR